MATPIHKVEPVYPALAKQARVSGTVELLGVLGTDGRIHELKVLRGHPLLINAALEAVRQWIFEPTLLNGQAVEVCRPHHGELHPATSELRARRDSPGHLLNTPSDRSHGSARWGQPVIGFAVDRSP